MHAPVSKKAGKVPAQAKTLIVQWEFAEDDPEWHAAARATPAVPPPAHQWGWRWWAASSAAILFLVAAGGWLWVQAHAGLRQIEGELQAAVEAGQWRPQVDSRIDASHISVIQDIAKGEQGPRGPQVELLDLRKEWAIVAVTTNLTLPLGPRQPARPLGPAQQEEISYRQTRLYRKDASGWVAAAPSTALWGAPRTLETTYFIFHYYALDSEAVAQAAVKLDAFYPDLAASYPLDPTSDGKREIRVSPEYSLAGTINRSSGAALEIASPAIYLAPTTVSEGDILAEAALLDLLKALSDQSIEYQLPDLSRDYNATGRVYALLESLQLWQLWSTDLPLAALYKPTIEWLYSDVHGKHAPPAFNARLCSLHVLWRAAPYAIQIPLFCGEPPQLGRYEVGRYLPLAPPRSLAEIHLFPRTMPDEPYQPPIEAERVGLATVFDYAVTTYGRQSLAKLIANAVSYSSWETLIPASFGVPFSDFETGWQAYLTGSQR